MYKKGMIDTPRVVENLILAEILEHNKHVRRSVACVCVS